jgi:hypothetical protein
MDSTHTTSMIIAACDDLEEYTKTAPHLDAVIVAKYLGYIRGLAKIALRTEGDTCPTPQTIS